MDTGPQNSIMGDLDEPTNIPETQVPEQDLTEEKKLAKFSKTAEFKRLKDYIEARIEFFQKSLPNGSAIVTQGTTELVTDWKIANIVIAEFKAILEAYENANDAVK